MTRLLLTVFFVGLLVSAASFAVAVSLGADWPPRLGKANLGHRVERHDKERDAVRADAGPAAAREIAWDGSDTLGIDVPAEVTFTQGSDAKVTLTGPKNWIDAIRVDDGEISFSEHRHWRSNGESLKIAVVAPSVRRFELKGAQRLTIASYNQDTMEVTLDGAGEVSADGRVRFLEVEMNGAGSGDFGKLVTSEAEITLNGAGSVTAAPTERANLRINGFGSIDLRTRPKELHKEIKGIGVVTQTDAATRAPPSPPRPPKPSAPPPPPNA